MLYSFLYSSRRRVCGFVARHKTFFIASTVTSLCLTSALYYAYRRVLQHASVITNDLQTQLMLHRQFQNFLQEILQQCSFTYRHYLPMIRDSIQEKIALEDTVLALRDPRLKKDTRYTLWEQVKEFALERMYASIILYSMWHLVVYALLGVIGYDIFEGKKNQICEDKSWDAYHNFIQMGIDMFTKNTMNKVLEVVKDRITGNVLLKGWQVHQKGKVSESDFRHLLNDIQNSLHITQPSDSLESDDVALYLSLIPLHEMDTNSNGAVHERLKRILTSQKAKQALAATMQSVSKAFHKNLMETLYTKKETENGSTNNILLPLAKILPQLQSETKKMSNGGDEGGRDYLEDITKVQAFQVFIESIFEGNGESSLQ